jgi:putative transcriptional regulator
MGDIINVRSYDNGGVKMPSIKELREKQGLTQEELSNTLNVGRTAVTMWETGKTFPRSELLPKIAEVLKCSIDDLFDSAKEE